MKKIAFNSANFVSRTSNFSILEEDWSIGEHATSEAFKPLETFEEMFDSLVSDIKELGFDYMDLWYAHLSWAWAEAAHVEIARRVLAKYDMKILSYVGEFGSTAEEFTAACRLVKALDFDLMGGGSAFYVNKPAEAVEILRREGVRFAFENHPNEKGIEDIQRLIGEAPADLVGATIDTGWFMTYGIPDDEAVRVLLDRVMHVHLKDIEAVGGHETCTYGDGIVPLAECVRILEEGGYQGHYSIEHEPYTFDPSADCVRSKALLENWLEEVAK